MEFSTPDFKNLIHLQELETLIKNENENIKKIEENTNQINLRNKELTEKLLEFKKEIQDLSIEKNKLENELLSIEEKIKKLQIEINQTKKVEQYNAINTEITKLKQDKDEIENKIIIKIDEIENKKSEFDKLSKDVEKEKLTFQEMLVKLEQEKKRVINYISELEKQKNEIRASISDQKILSKFDMLIKTKDRLAISQAKTLKREDNNQIIYICSACKMKLNANDISSLKKINTFAVCQNCSRLIYFEGELL